MATTSPGPMRVLHVSQPTEAGVANVVLEYAAEQVERGWDVHLAAPGDEGYVGSTIEATGATHHSWSASRAPGPGVLPEAQALRRIVEMIDPDVVHLHSSKAGMAGRLAVHGSRPTIFQPHAWSFEAVTGSMRIASLRWERTARVWTTHTLCVSQAELELGRAKGCLPARSSVINNGVHLESWQGVGRQDARHVLGLSQTAPIVVIVGRLAKQKGQDLALILWPLLRRLIPDAQLFLIGEGPMRPELEARLTPGVTIVGKEHPRAWYAAANVVFVPSRWEGMPLVLLEAMASARCVLASDAAGMREALADDDQVFRIGAEATILHALRNRLSDSATTDQVGARNRERVRAAFTARASAAKVADLTTSLRRHSMRSGSKLRPTPGMSIS